MKKAPESSDVSMVCVCRVVRVCVYEQMLQLYPDKRRQKKIRKWW